MSDVQLFEKLVKAGLAGTILAEIGFETANSTSLPSRLERINPTGSTAMLDSIGSGISLILKLNNVLMQLEMKGIWNFVHIVLTDGEDNQSKTTLEDISALMLLIGATLQTSVIKTYFIGVDVEQSLKATKDLVQLTMLGGDNADFIKISDVNIGSIFEKIKVQLGIQERTEMIGIGNQGLALIGMRQAYQPYLSISEQRYVVLFNLDISGSMNGSRWNRVCTSVRRFISSLGPSDLVGGIVFNDKCTILKPQLAPPTQFNSAPRPQITSAPQFNSAPIRPQSTSAPRFNTTPRDSSRNSHRISSYSKSKKKDCCMIF